MICIEGKTAFSGIAIGPIREFTKKSSAVRRSHVDDTAAECTRFEEAKKVAMEELGALYDKAVKEVGEDNAAIFEVHQMMLDDEDYCDSIRHDTGGQCRVCRCYDRGQLCGDVRRHG